MYPNRTMCDVLREMRDCYKTRNFCSLNGLIEECQSMGNRMEAGLQDYHDIKGFREEKAKLKQDINKLQQKKASLKAKQ